ncbi:MAG: FecR domain-containing protein [Alphaproteobacteria bacterium]
MLNRCFAVVMVAGLLFLNVSAAKAQERDGIIGTIIEVEGTATIASSGGAEAPVKDDQPVYMGDVISTGADGKAVLLLIDNTRWTLAERAKFRVDDYMFDAGDNTYNQARYSVLGGAFQYVSGLVAKKEDPDVAIETPAGSIGIRGTDFTATPDAAGGYDVYVDEGAVNVKNEAGETLLKQGEGSFVRDRKSAPGKPNAWRKERLEKMRGAVAMKRKEQIMKRIGDMKGRQQALAQKYRDFMQKNPAMKAKMQQRREQRKQQMQERLQERKGQMQENRQQQMQERKEQIRENMREKIEERREQRQQQGVQPYRRLRQ